MLNTNKYFSFPNSSINTFKESFNKFLEDMNDTSLKNVISNHTIKNPHTTVPYSWNSNVLTGNIVFNDSGAYSTITFNAANQSIDQNIVSKLLPDTDYMLSFEFKSTAACKFSLMHNGVGLTNRDSGVTSSTIEGIYNNSTEGFSYNTRSKGYLYFKTPSILGTSLKVSISTTDSTNTITIYNLTCQKGDIDFFETSTSSFLEDSTRYELGKWTLTQDGTNYRKIILDGDVEASLVSTDLRDEANNVNYNIKINNESMYLNPSIIVIDDVPYTVNSSFVDAYNAYEIQHINSEIVGDDGLHKIPDTDTGLFYDIQVNGSGVPELVLNNDVSDTSGAERFYLTYNVTHSKGGEHLFKNSVGVYDKQLILTLNESTGTKSLTTTTLSKTNILISDDHNLLASYFVDATKNVFHDLNGNHIINDTMNRNWILGVKSGVFNYSPIYSATLSDDVYNSFKLEHDIYGRHIFRDVVNRKYFYLYIENGILKLKQTNFTQISSKQDILNSYNFEHDIDGKHVFRDIVTGLYYRINIVSADSITLTNISNPVREFHHDNINVKFLEEHFINTDITNFITHAIPDAFTNYHLFLNNGDIINVSNFTGSSVMASPDYIHEDYFELGV